MQLVCVFFFILEKKKPRNVMRKAMQEVVHVLDNAWLDENNIKFTHNKINLITWCSTNFLYKNIKFPFIFF